MSRSPARSPRLLLLLLTTGMVAGYRNNVGEKTDLVSSLGIGNSALIDEEAAGDDAKDAVTSAYLQGLQDGAKLRTEPSQVQSTEDLQKQKGAAKAEEATSAASTEAAGVIEASEGAEKQKEEFEQVSKEMADRLAKAVAQQGQLQGGKVPDAADAVSVGGDAGTVYYDGQPTWQYAVVDTKPVTWGEWFFAIGGGTGASVSPTGDSHMDQDLLRRMRYQDKAVMLLLLLAYTGALFFSATIAYRQASNDSPVTYYADPRYHNLTTDSEDTENFLDAFNQPPKDAQLQVTGLMQLPPLPEYMVDAAVMWLGARYRIAFSFALDLSPWLVHDGTRMDDQDDQDVPDSVLGVDTEEVERLAHYLAHDANDLSYVEMEKVVAWKDWEELATNIKSKIRQAGFTGVVDVRRNSHEVVAVHKNRTWANFVHSRTTKVLLALSVVGWFVYQPYMWIRHRAIQVKCRYRVDIGIGQYWPLISEKIGPEGFDNGMAGNIMRVPRNSRQQQQQQQQRQNQQRQLVDQLENSRW